MLMIKKTTIHISLLFIFLFPFLDAKGQLSCLPPTNLTATQITETTATLRWISQNPPVNDHCWNIEVGYPGVYLQCRSVCGKYSCLYLNSRCFRFRDQSLLTR